MKKNRRLDRILALAAVVAMLCVPALAAGPGSDTDPLVALSYLQETFLNSIMEKVDQRIDERNN